MRDPRPVTRVEISDKNRTLRWIAVIALLVVGVLALTAGFMGLLNQDTGWQQVQITPQERSCSESFLLRYNFSGSGAEATALNKKLEAAYEEACVKAYQLFTPDESIDGVNNVYYVNHHPNETITVDPVLYEAFAQLEDTPYLYLGPAYAYYYGIIFSAEEATVSELDPAQDADAMAYVSRLAQFAADRNAVKLELLGNDQVKLHVSEEYLEFARNEEIDVFIDFAYMTNAFIIDYLAETLIAQDLTRGYIVSADGFTRNLDSENAFRFNIFDREGSTAYHAGVMTYNGPISIVFLKDYPTAGSDVNYRAIGDRYIHLFADPADGMYRTSTANLISYSYDTGCVEVLLQMLPSFVGDSFSVPQGVFSVWCEDGVVCYNDDRVSIGSLMMTADKSYRAELKK